MTEKKQMYTQSKVPTPTRVQIPNQQTKNGFNLNKTL